MVDVNVKRITYKRKRPNPEIEETLKNLLYEAKLKKSNLTSILEEALTSVSSYPLPLRSGAECAILKGFDKRLCKFLDQHLTFGEDKNEDVLLQNSETVEAKTIDSSEDNRLSTEKHNGRPHSSIKKTKKYKPAYRSGAYAILLTLDSLTRTNSSNCALKKEDLIEKAQQYCDESFVRPKPGSFYTSWSSMAKLISKGFVKKSKTKNTFYYSLTDKGIDLAAELAIEAKSKSSDNDIIFSNPLSQQLDEEKNIPEEHHLIPQVESLENTPCSNLDTEDLNECFITLPAGSFDVILLIDKNETSGLNKKNDPTIAEYKKYPNLKHEYRSLKVGDFTWIARHRVHEHQELVLPYIVERKRMDDLGASIKDGRFHEQKFRLKRCGLKNVLYMVEKYGSNKHVGLPLQSLMQALANTREMDNFKIHITDSLLHSARFLAMMTARLVESFKNKELKGCNRNTNGEYLMTFDYFNKASLKTKNVTVKDMFMRMLLQLKGISVEKALAITDIYPTPKSLIEAYKSCSTENKEFLLANINCITSKRIGPAISKTLYYLFNNQEFD